MQHRWRTITAKGLAGVATATAIGLSLAGCGAAAEPVTVLDNASPTTTADPAIEPSALTTTPDQGGGDATTGNRPGSHSGGNSGSGGSSSSGGGGQPANEPPYVRDIYPDVYVTDDEGTGRVIIGAIVQGHAYDPDGPDDQENTARIQIDWGDGTTTDADLEGHGAFRAWHGYDPSSYAGQTMTVRIVAHGHDGQTATETITLNLPRSVR